VAVLAGAGLLVLHSGSSRKALPSPQQTRAMEASALRRLTFPRDFVRLAKGCPTAACYVVGRPAARVATLLPGMMRAAGIQAPGRLKFAEPLAQLRSAHWVTSSSDPLVLACKTVSTQSGWHEPVCQDAGRVGSTLVNVLVEPYQPCHQPSCTQLGRSEILTWAVALPESG
jgi:hypothetical protein